MNKTYKYFLYQPDKDIIVKIDENVLNVATSRVGYDSNATGVSGEVIWSIYPMCNVGYEGQWLLAPFQQISYKRVKEIIEADSAENPKAPEVAKDTRKKYTVMHMVYSGFNNFYNPVFVRVRTNDIHKYLSQKDWDVQKVFEGWPKSV